MLATLVLTAVLGSTPASFVSELGPGAQLGLSTLDCQVCGVPLAQASPEPSRRTVLQRRIDDLNLEIRALNTDWPLPALLASYAGYVLAPVVLVGGAFLAVGIASGIPGLLLVGVVGIVVGAVGVVLLVTGIIWGMNASSAAKAKRNELVRERTDLERELKALEQNGNQTVWRSGLAPAGQPDRPVLLTLAVF